MITIRDMMEDQQLFGNAFGDSSWANWRALLAGFYGLELDDDEAEVFRTLTGRNPLAEAANELALVIGRRGGKSAAAALLAVYEAVFNDHASNLAAGEVATVMVISEGKKSARAVMRYVRGMLEHPMFAPMVMRDQVESIELTNRCAIEVMPASHRSTRGYSAAAVICDEIAFWRSNEDSANPDREILNAIRPSLATLGGKLIMLSSPYARRGVLWDAYKNHFGKNSERVLVAQAPSLLMNPTLPAHVVDDAYLDDPASAAAEFGAQFRSDIESYISIEAIERVTRPSHIELSYSAGIRYQAFVDPSGGMQDAFTIAIGHKDGDNVVIDLARAVKPPFSPEAVTDEFAELLKSYGIKRVTGDAYAGEWPREQFRKRGINYDKSERNRSEIYRDLLPLINSERLELPPIRELQQQFVGLERRTSRGGRDSIDHGQGQHDDLANSVAGVAVHLSQKKEPFKPITVTFQY